MKGYKPRIDLDIIKVLGSNMYSNEAHAIAELIANAHDANAKNVWITLKKNGIEILDDGSGMFEKDIEKSFLNIGTNLRHTNDYKKMGRKGIGKLASLFISDDVKVISKRQNKTCGLLMSLNKEKLIKSGETYKFPALLENEIMEHIIDIKSSGTKIVLENLSTKLSSKNMEYVIKDMFDSNKINIFINDKKINLKFRTAPEIVIGMVVFGDREKANIPEEYKVIQKEYIKEPIFKNYKTSASGWVVVFETIDKNKLNSSGINEILDINKISVFSRGKLGLNNFIPYIDKSRISDRYISGYVNAPVFEEGDIDMALPNRQGYSEKDDRFITLKNTLDQVASKLSGIRSKWATEKKKNEINKKMEKKRKQIEIAQNTIQNILKENIDRTKGKKEITELSQRIIQATSDVLPENREPILLVSHSEEDKTFAELIGKILEKCGFRSPRNAEITDIKQALISSIPGWGVPDGEDFWEWVMENCVGYSSIKPGKVLFLASKKSTNSFNVGVEAGIAISTSQVKSKKEIKRKVILIDDLDYKDIRSVLKTKINQINKSLYKERNNAINFIEILFSNLWGLLKIYGDTEEEKNNLKKAIKESIFEMKNELKKAFDKIDIEKNEKN